MSKYLRDIRIIPIAVILYVLILFIPSFSLYFHQDEFIHFKYSQTSSQVINSFNILKKGEFPFYRPLPTQVYFYTGHKLFGLNPLPFRIINFLLLAGNIILVYIFVSTVTKKETAGAIASILYGINGTHVAPIFAPAYVHELLYVFFAMCSVYAYVLFQKNKKVAFYLVSITGFVLALMTKENAVALPGIIALCEILLIGRSFRRVVLRLIPFATILGIYLVSHFAFYGIAQSSSYVVQIGKPTLNILIWYLAWALSTPNILVDFLGPKLSLNDTFFAVAGVHAYVYVVFFPVFLALGTGLTVWVYKSTREKRTFMRVICFGVLWFIVGLTPLLPFPNHKLGTEQAFALVGLALCIGYIGSLLLEYKKMKWVVCVWIVMYIAIATNTIVLARQTHWVAKSAKLAKNVIMYIEKNYPDLTNKNIILFKDGEIVIPEYGSSKELYYALGNGYGINLMLGIPNLQTRFQFNTPAFSTYLENKNAVVIDSSQLLGY